MNSSVTCIFDKQCLIHYLNTEYLTSSVTCSIWVFDNQCLILYLNTLSIEYWVLSSVTQPFLQSSLFVLLLFLCSRLLTYRPTVSVLLTSLFAISSFSSSLNCFFHPVISFIIDLLTSLCKVHFEFIDLLLSIFIWLWSYVLYFQVYWPACLYPKVKTMFDGHKVAEIVIAPQDISLSLSFTLAEEVTIIRSIGIQYQ